MAASQIMEMTSSEDEDQDLIELEAIRRPHRAVRCEYYTAYRQPDVNPIGKK